MMEQTSQVLAQAIITEILMSTTNHHSKGCYFPYDYISKDTAFLFTCLNEEEDQNAKQDEIEIIVQLINKQYF